MAFWFNKAGSAGRNSHNPLDPSRRRGGYELTFDGSVPVGDLRKGSHFYVRLISRFGEGSFEGIEIKSKTRIRMGIPQHLVVNYDGSGKAGGLRLFLDGKPFEVEVLHDNLNGSIRNDGQLEIGNKDLGSPYRGNLDDLRIYQRELNAAEIDTSLHHPIRSSDR
jgi:hypothetical protein